MKPQRVNGRGSAAVADRQGRRTGRVGPSVSVRVHRSGGWTNYEVEGEVDIQALPLMGDLVGSDAPRVVFDLHGVTFMDARGLGLMVAIQRRALASGVRVRLAAPSRSVRRVLMLTGCDPVFETFESLREAVSAPVGPAPEPAS